MTDEFSVPTGSPLPGANVDNVIGKGGSPKTDKIVDRAALFQPKDEEVPPPGVNWFEHNYGHRTMPAHQGIKVQVSVKEMAQFTEQFVNAGDLGSIVQAWRNAKIEVTVVKGAPIVNVKMVPG